MAGGGLWLKQSEWLHTSEWWYLELKVCFPTLIKGHFYTLELSFLIKSEDSPRYHTFSFFSFGQERFKYGLFIMAVLNWQLAVLCCYLFSEQEEKGVICLAGQIQYEEKLLVCMKGTFSVKYKDKRKQTKQTSESSGYHIKRRGAQLYLQAFRLYWGPRVSDSSTVVDLPSSIHSSHTSQFHYSQQGCWKACMNSSACGVVALCGMGIGI